MKKILFFLLVIPVCSIAQKKDKTAVTISKSITAADLKNHLYVIAGAEMEGRNTPSTGLSKAADYIEDHFKSFGLLPGNQGSYRLSYPLYSDSVTGSSLKVNGSAFELNKDYLLLSSSYAAEMAFSEAVFAGFGITDSQRNDYKDLNVRGKLVILLDGTPEDYKSAARGFNSPSSTFGKISTAQKNGAAAILMIVNSTRGRNNAAVSSWSLNKYRSSVSPLTFGISGEVAAAIMGEAGKKIAADKKNLPDPAVYKAEIDLSFFKTTRVTYADNVLGMIEGTDKKDEWVILTAHYDHIGTRNDTIINYGADDDGSGTVSILELAQAFAKAKAEGKGPRRSMLFMTVSGEEHGLWGSAYYSNHPVVPLEKTSVDLNIDMIGRIGYDYQKEKDSMNYVYIIGDDKLSSDLKPITDKVNTTYMKMKLDRKYNDPKDPNRFYYRSDHFNFAQKGIPIIFYFNGVHKDYHRPTDTPDKINYPLMEKRAKLVFFTAWEIANRDAMLSRDIPLN